MRSQRTSSAAGHHHTPSTPSTPNPTKTAFPLSSLTMASGSTALQRRAHKNPALEAKIAHMSLRLAPLVQLTTGEVHPSFPLTFLQFWLLTEVQLDSLASFYHQAGTPNIYSTHYPCPISWSSGLGLEEKRRKLGKFIGLKDCETPVVASLPVSVEDGERQQQAALTAEIIVRARRAREEEEEMRGKMWGRF